MNTLLKAAIIGAASVVAATGLAQSASAHPENVNKFLDLTHAYGFYPTDGYESTIIIAGEEVCALASQDYSQNQIEAAMVSVGAANGVSDAAWFLGAANDAFCPKLAIGALQGHGSVPPLEQLAEVRQR
jgi:hypothetical protein